jgi:hypothetical protein
MTRVRLPGPDDLAAEPPLAAVYLLEVAAIIAATALRAWHPAVVGSFCPPEDAEISSARVLFNECAHLCETLDDYRRLVKSRLARQRDDWPF